MLILQGQGSKKQGPGEVKKERDVGFAWQPNLRIAFQFNIWIALGGAVKCFTGERTERQKTISERSSLTHSI